MAENPHIAIYLMRQLASLLGDSDRRTVNLTQKHIRGRLAEALCMLVDNYGYEDDGKTLKIYMAREDLANLSNMTTANAIRTLSTFAQERIITVDGRRIRIVDESTLRNISRFG
jgi:CRP-like cAMP-binding protein